MSRYFQHNFHLVHISELSNTIFPLHLLDYNWIISMMTSWHGNAYSITGLLWGGVTNGFCSEKASYTEVFDGCFAVCLNKLLNNCWWFDMPWHPCDMIIIVMMRERGPSLTSHHWIQVTHHNTSVLQVSSGCKLRYSGLYESLCGKYCWHVW